MPEKKENKKKPHKQQKSPRRPITRGAKTLSLSNQAMLFWLRPEACQAKPHCLEKKGATAVSTSEVAKAASLMSLLVRERLFFEVADLWPADQETFSRIRRKGGGEAQEYTCRFVAELSG